METSLHRELKRLYADDSEQTEVPVDRFRIDTVNGDELVEIQHGSLAAIRRKIGRLLEDHTVRVVKPIVAGKQIVKRRRRGGTIQHRRRSPKRQGVLALFGELVYFTKVFPHPRLTLEVPLVEVEEWRYPGHGRRRRWRRNDFVIEDQKLLEIQDVHRFRTAEDLAQLMPAGLPRPFHTGDLAEALNTPRGTAQQIAYCLRETGAAAQTGKQGNTRLYVLGEVSGE